MTQTDTEIEPLAQLPHESAEEHSKFMAYFLQPGRRTIRGGYRYWCQLRGVKPRKNPPSTWFALARGETRAAKKLNRDLGKIRQAEAARGQLDRERICAVIHHHGGFGDDEFRNAQVFVKYCFWALGLDKSGEPIPDCPTWSEIDAASDDRAAELAALYAELTAPHAFYKR